MKILSIQPSISVIKNTVSNSSGKNLFGKILKPKAAVTETFDVAETPLIANLKVYYKNAKEKLNDIFLERTQDNHSTITVEHNMDAFDRLPKEVQDAIKPGDISIDGSIPQSTINKLFNAAKEANKPGCNGVAPSFWGRPENVTELDPGMSDIMADEISTGIAEHGDIIAEAGAEHLTDIATESLADGITETATEMGAEAATEGVIDHLIDSALG